MSTSRLFAVALLLVLPATLPAQRRGGGGGQPARNLQVLPKDMPRPELTATMRSFAMSLGVRCNHCHVVTGTGPNGQEEIDYVADDKETKAVAREMLKMVMDINAKYLPTTGRTIHARNQVTCETCHHGLARPRTLRAALGEAVEAKGADSAIVLYRALRERYYGTAAYDFGEMSLVEAANELGRSNQRPAAIALLKLNLEHHPQSGQTYNALAQQSLQSGDTTAAVEALNKVLEIQPNNQQARALLTRLRPGGGH